MHEAESVCSFVCVDGEKKCLVQSHRKSNGTIPQELNRMHHAHTNTPIQSMKKAPKRNTER